MSDIKLTYRAVDGARIARSFKTVKGASAFARKYVGDHPELGRSYAVSADGVGTIRNLVGVTMAELFPATVERPEYPTDEDVEAAMNAAFEAERARDLAAAMEDYPPEPPVRFDEDGNPMDVAHGYWF